MLRGFHSRKKFFDSRKNHRFRFVRAGELLYRIHRIKSKQRDEFHFVAIFADEQVCVAISFDVSCSNTGKNFVAQHVLIRFRVGSFRPAMPDPRDHRCHNGRARRFHDSITSTNKTRTKLHSHYLISAIDIDDLAGYCRGSIASQKNSGSA
jgi:hypothetical protein